MSCNNRGNNQSLLNITYVVHCMNESAQFLRLQVKPACSAIAQSTCHVLSSFRGFVFAFELVIGKRREKEINKKKNK